MTAPIPIGVTASFSAVATGSLATPTFSLPEGLAVITFQPVDVNNPGVATLYDSTNTAVVTMNSEGYESLMVPSGGATYYFRATLGANILAATMPSIWR